MTTLPLYHPDRPMLKMRPIKAFKHFRNLVANKESTEEVFHIFQSLPSRNFLTEVENFVNSEKGKALMASEPDLPPLLDDHTRLRTMPKGSVAHAYCDFMEREGLTAAGLVEAVLCEVINPLKHAAHTGGPAHRAHVQRQHIGDFVHQIERLPPLTVHLVDEGDNRHAAQPAHLKQFARLRLDALRGVDDHDGGINGGQRAIGVFGKILVPRRVQQVEGDTLPFKRHHAGGHGNPALLFNLHPVGPRASRRAAGLHLARQVNSAALQQQFLGQRGLTRVGVGDNGEGAAAIGHARAFRGWVARRQLFFAPVTLLPYSHGKGFALQQEHRP